jgi:predicted ATPase
VALDESATRAELAELADAPTPRDPQTAYRERLAYFTTLRDAYNRRRYRWANLSVVAFLGALALLVVAAFEGGGWWLVGGLLALALFVVAFVRQAQLDERHRRYVALCELSAEGLARLRRDWSHMTLRAAPSPGETPETPVNALAASNAADLDLLGHASLQHLLHTVTTPAGQELLAAWLLAPAPPALIRERQAAVRELAPQINLRDELSVFGKLSNMQASQYRRFIGWAGESARLVSGSWLSTWSFVAPVALALLVAAQISGVIPYPLWLLVLIGNLAVIQWRGQQIETEVDRVAGTRNAFLPYAGLFAFLRTQRYEAPLLRRTHGALEAVSGSADAQLRTLGRIMRFGDARLSVIGPALQIGLLWNVHTLRLLEGWRARSGSRVGGWFALLAEVEALAGLGALSFDNPEWAFPDITEMSDASRLEAQALGHPLLPPDACVRNDVTVGPPGTFLLVTGSNMSGKSTLLRAIGVNVALAQAGAPVCAASMSLPPLALGSSMRAQDSLEEGVSYFMAELRRLKQVVDYLRAVAQQGERVPVFLLDEILSGTNTSERQIAARTVIRYLLDHGATGVVSTHDLTLAQAPDLTPLSQSVHFTERFTRDENGPAMTFDYLLRPGIATSVNALKLMELVGLPAPEGVDTARPEDSQRVGQ